MNRYTINNTICQTWFERDRANVTLMDKESGLYIVNMWDETVYDFVFDGYKTHRQTWHEALVDYCNEMGITI